MGKPNPTPPEPVSDKTATRTRSRRRSPGRSDARFRAGSPGRDAPRSRGRRSRLRRISSAVFRSARTSPRTLTATSPLRMRMQPVNESVGSIRGMPATTAQTSSAPALAVASPAASEILVDRLGASRMPPASRLRSPCRSCWASRAPQRYAERDIRRGRRGRGRREGGRKERSHPREAPGTTRRADLWPLRLFLVLIEVSIEY